MGIELPELRKQRLTIGRLIAIIIAAVTIGSAAIAIARYTDISRHEDKAIERAHPDIQLRYVTHRDLQKILGEIDRRLTIIETLLRKNINKTHNLRGI